MKIKEMQFASDTFIKDLVNFAEDDPTKFVARAIYASELNSTTDSTPESIMVEYLLYNYRLNISPIDGISKNIYRGVVVASLTPDTHIVPAAYRNIWINLVIPNGMNPSFYTDIVSLLKGYMKPPGDGWFDNLPTEEDIGRVPARQIRKLITDIAYEYEVITKGSFDWICKAEEKDIQDYSCTVAEYNDLTPTIDEMVDFRTVVNYAEVNPLYFIPHVAIAKKILKSGGKVTSLEKMVLFVYHSGYSIEVKKLNDPYLKFVGKSPLHNSHHSIVATATFTPKILCVIDNGDESDKYYSHAVVTDIAANLLNYSPECSQSDSAIVESVMTAFYNGLRESLGSMSGSYDKFVIKGDEEQ